MIAIQLKDLELGAGAPEHRVWALYLGVLSPLSQPSSCSESYRSVNHPCSQTEEDGFGLSAVSPPRSAKVFESNSDVAESTINAETPRVN
jgi:hypothetical protein